MAKQENNIYNWFTKKYPNHPQAEHMNKQATFSNLIQHKDIESYIGISNKDILNIVAGEILDRMGVQPATRAKQAKNEKSKLNADAEALMMGFTITITKQTDAYYIMDYVHKTLSNCKQLFSKPFSNKIYEAMDGQEIAKLYLCTMDDMILLSVIPKGEDILDPDGCFNYCYNITYPDYSEWGYTLFKMKNKRPCRIS